YDENVSALGHRCGANDIRLQGTGPPGYATIPVCTGPRAGTPMKNSVRLAALLAFACMSTAFAQGYPNRPIRVIIPWPPGQATDLAARMVSEKLVPVLG